MRKTSDPYRWWQKAIFYHIYPLSFLDSNGDGKGDLRGITERIDYLAWLGIDAIWISSFYRSPMLDLGYDVSNYREIDPVFGTIDDLEQLFKECHAHGIKVVLDFVPNHSSDQHPWFRESRSSRDNEKRDWYLWRDPVPGGGPPNNWVSSFGGSAWEWDERSDQYYYHAFLKEQPDLNWRNPDVQKEMLDVMRFWLDRGADGLRVDSMWHLLKDHLFRDNPPNPDWHPGMLTYHRYLPVYSANQPRVHDIIAMMRKVLDDYGDRVLIGEIYLPAEQVATYYGCSAEPGAQLPSNFELILLPWKADIINAGINKYIAAVPPFGWPNWVLSNHDKHRVVGRIGREQARVAALLQLTLPGTPRIYYGDEIGMKDVYVEEGKTVDRAEQKRDPERTPMQWNADRNAGFTQGTPWLPIAEDFDRYNVEEERKDPHSFLSFYRELISFRKQQPAFETGTYHPVGVSGSILAFVRKDHSDGGQFLVAANLGHEPGSLKSDRFTLKGSIAFGTKPDRIGQAVVDRVVLAEDEAVIIGLENRETVALK